MDPNRQYKIDHAGKIDKRSFKILVGFFTALSTIAALIRISFRLIALRKLYLDDWLVVFATACFLSATGVLFSYVNKIYVVEAFTRSVDVAFTVEELYSLMDIMKWNDIFLCLAWTSHFAIKFSFLAFFHTLVRDVSVRLSRFYWFVVGYTGIAWGFVIVEPFILCPHFDMKATACPNHTLDIVLVTFLFVVDMTTDIMIASIPIILLRMSHLRTIQKIRIGSFLSLSLVIVVVSLTRLVGGLYHSYRGKYEFSIQWTFTILHIEAAIALLMGSISALRTVFAKQSRNGSEEVDNSPVVIIYRKIISIAGSWKADGGSRSHDQHSPQLSTANNTEPTLKGFRTFIRRCGRSQGHTTLASTVSDLEDYHQFKRNEKVSDRERLEGEPPSTSAGTNTNTTHTVTSDDHDPWITKPESLSYPV